MAKFGLFEGAFNKPSQEFEGDCMLQEGEFVKIQTKPRSDNETGRTVAAIRLEKGWCVKEIM